MTAKRKIHYIKSPESEDFSREELEVRREVWRGQVVTDLSLSPEQNQVGVLGVKSPELGSDHQQFLLAPGCSGSSGQVLSGY